MYHVLSQKVPSEPFGSISLKQCSPQNDTDCCDQYSTSQHGASWREINGSRARELKLLAVKVNHQ